MTDMERGSPAKDAAATPFWRRPGIVAASILATGLVPGCYLLGDGLRRAKDAERAVTVRGLAERNVTANQAVWTVAHSAQATSLADAQADIEADTVVVCDFFRRAGFPADAVQATGATVSQFSDNGVPQ